MPSLDENYYTLLNLDRSANEKAIRETLRIANQHLKDIQEQEE